MSEAIREFDFESSFNDNQIGANSFDFTFENFCTGHAYLNTKGFWRNPKGIGVLRAHLEWIDYVNSLDPYSEVSYPDYFETGDEPFDEKYQNGVGVIAQFPNWTTNGTALAEIANFLVGDNYHNRSY